MFGLNKGKKGNEDKPFFQFPLEKDIDSPEKVKDMMEAAEKKILTIKKCIKEGAKPEDFEKLGTLLHAYSALLKIFNQIPSELNKNNK